MIVDGFKPIIVCCSQDDFFHCVSFSQEAPVATILHQGPSFAKLALEALPSIGALGRYIRVDPLKMQMHAIPDQTFFYCTHSSEVEGNCIKVERCELININCSYSLNWYCYFMIINTRLRK